jgi:hypothetical protein
MNNFKYKSKNRTFNDDRQTLDAKHLQMINIFSDTKHDIDKLKINLDEIKEQLSLLHLQNSNCNIINFQLQKQIWDLDDHKKTLESEIYKIEHNIDEHNYMLTTGKLLSNYYKILDEEKKITSGQSRDSIINTTMQDEDTITTKRKNITDWFSNNCIVENIDTGKKKLTITKKSNNLKTKISKPHETISYKNKDIIYDKYMKLIDKNYININTENIDIFDSCPKCLVEMLINNNTGMLLCVKCGLMETIIVDSDKPSFKEPPKEMTSSCYKRINHLNEFLAQFQAKEITEIHEDVYNEILMEIKKERISNMASITPKKMRDILRKIHKNDYYEHIPYIINQLNGLPAPVIAPEIEEIIRGMFKAIQIPFEKYCPNKRKNFLSYNYVMYKFFELLELDEYLHCFQLLKSRTKLHQQDQIWKNICIDLNWQFIKSL